MKCYIFKENSKFRYYIPTTSASKAPITKATVPFNSFRRKNRRRERSVSVRKSADCIRTESPPKPREKESAPYLRGVESEGCAAKYEVAPVTSRIAVTASDSEGIGMIAENAPAAHLKKTTKAQIEMQLCPALLTEEIKSKLCRGKSSRFSLFLANAPLNTP